MAGIGQQRHRAGGNAIARLDRDKGKVERRADRKGGAEARPRMAVAVVAVAMVAMMMAVVVMGMVVMAVMATTCMRNALS
jgi:hypothetical protein